MTPAAAMAPGEPLLRLRDVDFSYGALQVLFGVTLEVPRQSSIVLLGTNGAGKSTLLRVAAGLEPPARGTVAYDGEDVTTLPAEERARRGMVLVEGGRSVFPSLSVLENLAIVAPRRGPGRDRSAERLEEVLGLFPALRPMLRRAAGTLSGGEQQMVAVGRALLLEPRLLMIDELSLGLAPVVMEQMVEATRRVRESGVTILLVEQSLNVAIELAEHAYFMEKGEIRFSGPPSELLERGDLARSVFLGATR